jgi:DNA-binding transcriptional LysR family regulator
VDRLRAYEIFVTVVAKGSFTAAADALDTSPANVTRYVNDLEAHLATRLLNRSSRQLSLTESGEALYERMRAILEDVTEAEAGAMSSTLSPRGRLRINAPVSFGVLHLAPLWPRFHEQYPDIELDIDLIDRVVDLIGEGYDLAIRISRAGSTAHVGRKLASSHNVVCASPDYIARHGMPMTPADLASHACIDYSYSATGNDWLLLDDTGKIHLTRVSGVMHTNNGDTARHAALAGVGVIWQPTFLIGEDLRQGRLLPVLPGYHMPDIEVLAVYPSRRHLTAKVRVMIDFLVAAFADAPRWEFGRTTP